jgi:DNA-binding beta-propeller fold protein YncE
MITRDNWIRQWKGNTMKRIHVSALLILFVTVASYSVFTARAQESAPLKLVQTIKLGADIKGHFDHFGIDLKGQRLFVTAEDMKSVLVYGLADGKLIHTMGNISRPHAVLIRDDINRIYVTDGGTGDLKIFDASTYALISAVKLKLDADSIGYDPQTHLLYIDNGGGDVKETFSMISIVDTDTGAKVGDIKVDGDTLEALRLERSSPKMYVNNRAKNQIEVIDREKNAILTSWPVSGANMNVAMALDEAHHRLFIGCRSGHIVVFNTETGKQLQALPMDKGVDDVVFDAASGRIYASCDGAVNVYRETDPDHYQSLGKVPSGPGGRTSSLSPELHRYFVAVPAHDALPAEILTYEVN